MTPQQLLELLRPRPRSGSRLERRLARCHSIEDLATAARRRLPHAIQSYLEGGGEDEVTLRRNRAAFDELELVPHVLRDVSTVDTSTTLLGTDVTSPIALAPVGAPRIVHHIGEPAAARAAARGGVPFTLSTVGSTSVEVLADSTSAPLWMQLYVFGDRGADAAIIDRARECGYRALVVTVDCTVRSKRERERRAGLALPTPNVTPRTVLDGMLHPRWSWHFATSRIPSFPNVEQAVGGSSPLPDLAPLFDGTLAWDDLDWIVERWRGPVAVKGVLRAQDARRAAERGASAVIVSNHGGRQLDHVPATVDVLPTIVDAVGGDMEVLLDSGIRRGTDVVTALALGARGVLLGRGYLYGLAAGGEAGVTRALEIVTGELRTAMALCGASTLADLTPELVTRRSGRG